MAGEVKKGYTPDIKFLTEELKMSESEILNIVRERVRQSRRGEEFLAALQAEGKKLKDQEVTKTSHHLSLVHST